MKKIFTLMAAMVMAIAANAETKTLYSWESPEGEVSEKGGTIAYVNGDGDRLNYPNGTYYTICLNGKKANLSDATASANAGHMVITFDEPLKKGDEIAFTCFYNKGEQKNVSAWLVYENGNTASTAKVSADIATGAEPEVIKVTVTEDGDGSNTLTMTRNDAGTNMFITKLVITGEREGGKPQYDYSDIPDGIEPMDDYHAAIVRNGAFVEGEDGTKWWTVEGFGKATKQANSKHSAIEAYAGWGSLDVTEYSLNQRQYVSAGHYQMRCSGFFRQGEKFDTDPATSNAVIYVNEKEVPLATLGSETAVTYANSQATAAGVFDADMYVNILDFTLEESQEINFGVKGTFDMPKSWCIIGGIEIVRVDGYDYEKEVDVTAQYLVNPSFENSTEEWTVEGSWKEQNNGEAVKVGENYVEQWQAAGGLPAGKVYQTISVPNGTYRISAVANATAGGTFLFANDQKTEATAPAKEISVVAKVTDGQLTLGYERSEENQANWVAVDNFRIYEVKDKNTLLEADNYVITAVVEPAKGVDPAAIPEAFQKYLGIYTTTATLVGDENSLVITENAEEGLFDGFEVKGNAVAYSPEKVITLGGQKFTVRDSQNEGDSEETGELEIIPTNVKGYFFMEGADVYFKGKKIITVPTIVIRSEATDSEVVAEEQAEAPAQTVKVAENGRLLIKAAGKVFNVAGQQIQ